MPRISGLVLTLCRRRVLTPSHLLGKRSMSSFESWEAATKTPKYSGHVATPLTVKPRVSRRLLRGSEAAKPPIMHRDAVVCRGVVSRKATTLQIFLKKSFPNYFVLLNGRNTYL